MQIEGRNAVTELLKSGKAIDKVVIQKGAENSGSGGSIFRLIRERGVKYQFVPQSVMDTQSVSKKHQGFIAYAEDFTYSEVSDIIDYAKSKNQSPFIIILDEIQDPHNLGSIMRVCECAGCHGVIIGKFRSVSVNETVIKVSAGAASHVRVARVTNIVSAIEQLKEQGFWIYGSDASGESMYSAGFSADTPTALVIGSEGQGIKSVTKKACDKVLSIPMFGQINSLNASVACGVLIYEAQRQLRGGK